MGEPGEERNATRGTAEKANEAPTPTEAETPATDQEYEDLGPCGGRGLPEDLNPDDFDSPDEVDLDRGPCGGRARPEDLNPDDFE